MTILRQPWRWIPFGIRLRVARLRSRASQHHVVRNGVLIAFAVLVGAVLLGARTQASTAQAAWGETTDVLVVTEALGVGDELKGRVELATRPVAFLPDDALRSAVGGDDHAARMLEAGDVVTRRDLASTSHELRLEVDQRAVSLPLGPGVPKLGVGDHVELYVVFDTLGEADAPQAIERALVVDLGDDDVTVAVRSSDVAVLAQASASGQVIVVRR